MATKSNKKRQTGTKTRRRSSPPTPVESPVRALRTSMGLSQATMARLLDIGIRTLGRLETESSPTELPRSFRELKRLFQGLCQIMRPQYVAIWLQEPNDGFNGLKPIEAIDRGEVDRLWEMVYRVGSGEPM